MRKNPQTIERYGDNEFGRGALLARRSRRKGRAFRPDQPRRIRQPRRHLRRHARPRRGDGSRRSPRCIDDLRANGKLSRTLVIVLSEFGRTPRINDNGGRDHHARCFSAMIAGGGLKGGSIVGASDPDGMLPAERPVQVARHPRHGLSSRWASRPSARSSPLRAGRCVSCARRRNPSPSCYPDESKG